MLRHVLWALGIVLTLTVLFIVWADGNAVWGRLKTIRVEGNFFHPRIEIWRDALPMARVFALSGAGLGGFAAGFPAWQTSHLSQFWRHAHNDYLQILIENGIPGLICALAALFLFFRIVARKIRESRSDQLAGLLAGCAAAALTMITHSAVDFNLRITANAHLFAVVLALGAVVSDFKRNEYAGVILRLRLTGRGIIFLVLAAAGLSAALAVPSFAFFRARWLQSTAEKTQVLEIRELFLRRASAILPAAGGIRADLGRTLMRRSAGPGLLSAERSWFLSQAGRELRAAITLSPCLPEAWSDYGWYLANTGRPADGRIAMGRAAALAPRQPMIANSSRRYRDLFPDSDSKGARNRDLQVAPGRSRRASQLQ